MLYGRCSYAGEYRPINLFHKDCKSPDGFAQECKRCKNTKRRYYRRYGVSANLTREQEARMIREIRRNIREDVLQGTALQV